MFKTVIITISDRCSTGEREDLSGPYIAKMLESELYEIADRLLVSDEPDAIVNVLKSSLAADLILTTGGTGFGPRDNTPEATLKVIEKRASGLEHLLCATGLDKTPHAALSRAVAGIAGQTIIINLPGSVKAVEESLAALLPILPHALNLLAGSTDDADHKFKTRN